MVQLLDCTGCATTLGVPEKTLAQWRYQGKGPTYIKVGKYVRYRTEDVEAYLTANTIRPRVAS